MPVERVDHDLPVHVPPGHAGVVIAQLVERQREIPVGRLPGPRPADPRPGRPPASPGRPPRSCRGREAGGARTDRATGSYRIAVARSSCCRPGPARSARGRRLPHSGSFSASRAPDCGAVVVLRPRRPVAAYPLLANPPRLRPDLDPLLVDDGIKLLPHPPRSRLFLDHVPVDDAPAIGKRAGPVAARHRAGRLLAGRPDDLESAHPPPVRGRPRWRRCPWMRGPPARIIVIISRPEAAVSARSTGSGPVRVSRLPPLPRHRREASA